MKNLILVGAVAATVATVSPRVVRAQEMPDASVSTNAESGYELFLRVGQQFQPTPKDLSITNELAPAEKLRRKRLRLARNAEALPTFRAALWAGIVRPTSLDTGEKISEFYKSLINLSYLLDDEITVDSADENLEGAQQASLDFLELGNQLGRGGLTNYLDCFTISRDALRQAQQFASKLNARQSRDFAARWKALSDQTPTYQQMLRDEEQIVLQVARAKSAPESTPVQPGTTVEKPDVAATELEREVGRVFQMAIEGAAMPYQTGIKLQLLEGASDFTKDYASYPLSRNNRFRADSVTLGHRLFVAALQLHATKLESGVYPRNFDAGADPFSPTTGSLIYKRAGDSYVLYSVGPDGKDENGAEIQTLRINQDTGAKTVSDRLMPNSFGDIVAPVL